MRRFVWFLVICVALYAAIGFFALPPLLKTQLERRLGAELNRKVTVSRVQLNPLALSATLDGVEIGARGGTGEPLLGWRRLRVNFDLWSSWRRDWAFDEIALAGFHGTLDVDETGRTNFSDLVEKWRESDDEPKADSFWRRPLRIERLNVAEAHVKVSDLSHGAPFRTELGPVNLTLLEFRSEGARGAPYRFEATSEAGERLRWSGTISVAPLASAGEWRIENLALPKYAPYFQDRLNATVASGRVTASARYEASFGSDARLLVLRDGAIEVQDFRLVERGGSAPLIALATGQVTGIQADVAKSQVALDSIRLDGARLALQREADGSINLLKLFDGAKAAGGAPRTETHETPLELTAKEISLRDGAIELKDRAAPAPVQLAFSRVNGSVRNFTLAPGAPMPVDVTFGIDPQGTGHLAGNLTLDPGQADFTVEFAWVPLPPLSPYLEPVAAVRVARGIASLKGHVAISLGGPGPLRATFAGDGRIEDLALVDGTSGDELAGLSEFALQDLKLTTAPKLTVSLGELRLGGPFAHAVRTEDGKVDLASVLHDRPANVRAREDRGAPEVTITRVVVQGGEFSLADRSVQPAAELSVRQIGGALRNLSSLHPELGEVELQATVNGSGPLKLVGRISPLASSPGADLRVDLSSVDLAPLGPYVGKYAGFELERGRLFLDTQAKLTDQRLDAQNSLTLEEFTLGHATHSPAAVKLPVKLGVALLKDKEGKIQLDVPVQGSLADPEFQIGPVVGRAFTSVLAKAAKSPFALLGAMFGGGGEELAQEEFEAGTAELTAEGRTRLATVQRALVARPELGLEIVGGYDAAADAPSLKRRKVDELVKRRIWEARKARDPNVPPVEQLTVDDEERTVFLRRLYAETLAPGTVSQEPSRPEAPAQLPSAPTSEAPPPAVVPEPPRPEEHHGFIRRAFDRTVDIATLKGWREHRAERKAEEEQRQEEAQRAEEARRSAEAREKAAAAQQQRAPAEESPDVPQDEMIARLTERQPVTPEDLRGLADARARQVRDTLMNEGGISGERLELAKASDASAKIGHRVQLQLR